MAPPKPSAVHDTTTIEDSQIRSTGDSSSAGGGGGEDDDAATSKQDEKRKSSSNGHERDALGLDSTAGTTTTTREDDHVAEDETLTDAEYLAKRMKRTFDQVEAEPADDDDQVENGKAFEQDDEDRPGHENVDENDAGGQDGRAEGASPSRDLTIESILETGRLFVRNLAFSATQQDLETLFSRYGRLEQVRRRYEPFFSRSPPPLIPGSLNPESFLTLFPIIAGTHSSRQGDGTTERVGVRAVRSAVDRIERRGVPRARRHNVPRSPPAHLARRRSRATARTGPA